MNTKEKVAKKPEMGDSLEINHQNVPHTDKIIEKPKKVVKNLILVIFWEQKLPMELKLVTVYEKLQAVAK